MLLPLPALCFCVSQHDVLSFQALAVLSTLGTRSRCHLSFI